MSNFRFTRHILSCNNIDEGRIRGKDWEPAPTISGITRTLKKLKEDKEYNNNFISDTIYVSNLFRTWCTAVILYGPKKENLNIKVSPYLKEELQFNIQRGNWPGNIKKIKVKFLTFLNLLLDEELDTESLVFPNTIKLYFPSDNESNFTEENVIIYEKEKENNEYKIVKDPDIIDYITGIRSNDKSKWLKTGDLQKFMKWYNKHIHTEDLVHVITHSNVINSYFKNYYVIKNGKKVIMNTKKEFDDIDLSEIGGTNCWTFQTNIDMINTPEGESGSQLKERFKMVAGVEKEKEGSKKIEKEYKKKFKSLCSKFYDKKISNMVVKEEILPDNKKITTNHMVAKESQFIKSILIMIIVIGIIIKFLLSEKISEDGKTGPATATQWGYGTILISISLLTYMNMSNDGSNIPIPNFILIGIIIWYIMLNSLYKERINKGQVGSDFGKYETGFTISIIGQIILLVVSMSNENENEKVYITLSYLLSVINFMFLGIQHIILKFYSTDG